MLTSARPSPRFPLAMLATAGVGVALLLLLAKLVVHGDLLYAFVGVVVAALPGLAYVAFRWPVIFPLGVYLLLVPIDGLLVLGGGGTLTKLIGILAIGALVVRGLLTRRFAMPPATYFAWGAVIFYIFLTGFWTIDGGLTFGYFPIMGSLFALFTALAFYPVTFAEFLWMRRITIAAGLLTAFYGFYANATGQQMMDVKRHANARLSLSIGDLHFDPNHYAAYFMIPSAFIVAGFFAERRLWMRAAYAAAFAVIVANVFLSGSRGGLIGIALVVVYLGVRMRRFVSTAAVLLGGLAMSFAIPNVWSRVLDPTQGEGSGRFEIWATGLRGLRDFWLVGAGFASFPTVYDRYIIQSRQHLFAGWDRPPHNLVMESLVELGIAGTLIVGFAWWSTLRQNRSILRPHPLFVYRCASEAMIVALLWMAMTIDLLFFKYLWVALAFPMLLAKVYRPRALFGNEGTYATPTLRPSPARE